MKKKILTLCLVICLAATAIVGGTMAYFTDVESKENTMVIGNVQIDIDEVTYTDGKWEKFENDKFVLYPIDNAQGDALMNKVVYTANTSPSKDDAYIRNIILIEKNDLLDDSYVGESDCCFPGIHFGYASNDTTVSAADGKTYTGSTNVILEETATVNNEEYWVAVFTQKDGEAIPFDAALMSLSEVWMDKNISSEQIKGWGEDNKVTVIAYSQGIQAEGLSHEEAMAALGEVTVEYVEGLTIADDAVINSWTTKAG